jgi:Icc-related predicted phosphoesterase
MNVKELSIIAVSDIHSSKEFLEYFKKEFGEEKGKIFLFAGDIIESTKLSEEMFAFLEILSKNNQVFAIPGNIDRAFVNEKLEQLGINVDKKRKEIVGKELNIVGFGGSLKTPFFTPNERREEEFYSIFEIVDSKTILLTHTPPFGIFDEVLGKHIGSKVLKEIIEKKNPYMLICGHVHELYGVNKINNTIIVKLPPAKLGFVGKITNGKVEFVNLFRREKFF